MRPAGAPLDRQLVPVAHLPAGWDGIECMLCGRLVPAGRKAVAVTVGLIADPAEPDGCRESMEMWCLRCGWPWRRRLAAWRPW